MNTLICKVGILWMKCRVLVTTYTIFSWQSPISLMNPSSQKVPYKPLCYYQPFDRSIPSAYYLQIIIHYSFIFILFTILFVLFYFYFIYFECQELSDVKMGDYWQSTAPISTSTYFIPTLLTSLQFVSHHHQPFTVCRWGCLY